MGSEGTASDLRIKKKRRKSRKKKKRRQELFSFTFTHRGLNISTDTHTDIR